jgi:hypothetical protein
LRKHNGKPGELPACKGNRDAYRELAMKPPVADATVMILVSRHEGNQSKKSRALKQTRQSTIVGFVAKYKTKKKVCTNLS